jgi:phosphohistidine phosphatase
VKTLTLLRHAKSGWDDRIPRDFDRPLNAKGRRAAQAMGRHLKTEGLIFDRIVASPAVRVVETLAEVGTGYDAEIEPMWDKRIYLASVTTLLDIVHETASDAERLLIVGHNPGLEDMVMLLVADGAADLRAAMEQKYPTATLAELSFDADDWAGVAPGTATLTRFTRPRDLDAALGPDAD